MKQAPKDLIGKPVVSISSGSELGVVDHLVFKPGEHQLYGLVVKPADAKAPNKLLCREDLQPIANDAITTPHDSTLTVLDADGNANEYMSFSLQGLKILTEAGDEIGKVDSLALSDDDGSVHSYHSSTGFLGLGQGVDIPRSEVIAAGRDAIVISSGAAKRMSGN